MYLHVIRMLVVFTRMSSLCDSYVFVSPVYIRMSSLCHSYVFVCHPYVTRMYSHVTRIARKHLYMSSVCHSYVLLYHPYVTRMYLYVTQMSSVSRSTFRKSIEVFFVK